MADPAGRAVAGGRAPTPATDAMLAAFNAAFDGVMHSGEGDLDDANRAGIAAAFAAWVDGLTPDGIATAFGYERHSPFLPFVVAEFRAALRRLGPPTGTPTEDQG